VKINSFIILFVIFTVLLISEESSAINFYRGSLHQHTGFSNLYGYDSNPFTTHDNCLPIGLEGHFIGYEVQELADEAANLGLDYLGFSDHSYCIDAGEFGTVRNDCVGARNGTFACLVGLELSTEDVLGDNESLLHCYTGANGRGEAHIGAYGINTFIFQTPPSVHCPSSPSAQAGINAISNQGGISILNHPHPSPTTSTFLDFESIYDVSGYTGVEIWNNDFGSLTENITKLANQMSIGIPMSKALDIFADDIGSMTVKRAISLIKEAEMAGGKIDDILDSVATSIYQVEKLKKERAAAISSLVVQGYIIFFIFIGIMLVMQFKIIPLTKDVQGVGGLSGIGNDITAGVPVSTGGRTDDLSRPLLYMLLLQGLFSGLAIGKLSEGSIKAGVKHSFVMTIAAFLITTGAKLFL